MTTTNSNVKRKGRRVRFQDPVTLRWGPWEPDTTRAKVEAAKKFTNQATSFGHAIAEVGKAAAKVSVPLEDFVAEVAEAEAGKAVLSHPNNTPARRSFISWYFRCVKKTEMRRANKVVANPNGWGFVGPFSETDFLYEAENNWQDFAEYPFSFMALPKPDLVDYVNEHLGTVYPHTTKMSRETLIGLLRSMEANDEAHVL